MPDTSNNLKSSVFSSFPPDAIEYLKSAFRVLANVPDDAWKQLSDFAAMGFGDHLLPSANERESWGLAEQDVRPLMVAVRLIVSAAADKMETADILLNSAIESGVVEEDIKEVIGRFISSVFENREALSDQASQRRLASETLPSLTAFEVSIEVRLGFGKEDNIERAVPVAILHIDTNTTDREIWLQMNAVEVRRVIEKLADVEKKLSLAENWAHQR